MMLAALRAATIAALLCLWAGSALAVAVGEPAIPIEGEDQSGERVSLESYLGRKTILLKFGSIYCSTCVSSLVDVVRIQEKFSPAELQVVGVNLDVQGMSRIRKFYRDYASLINYPMIIDEKLATSRPYDIQSIPAHVVIDKGGVVRYVSTGASEQDIRILEEVVTKVVRGESGVDRLMHELPLQVYLPSNFTKTYQDSVYVIGRTKPGSRVALVLNGGSRQNVKTMRDYFYIRTLLSLGSNYIELQVVDEQGRRVNQGVVVFRIPKVGTVVESPFPEYHFHVERNEAPCRKCHDLTPPPAEKGKGSVAANQMCLACHKELTGQRVVHGPITVGGCASCHQYASSPNRYQVLAQGQELCFKCHEEKRKELIKTYLHGPMSAGLCTICHSPHASSETFQVRKYVGDLCVMCHDGVKEEQRQKVVHKPVGDGACGKCHEPHSSNRNDSFRKFPGDGLCLSCHSDYRKKGHTHPYGVPPRMDRKLKLAKDGNLVCQSCHEVHASDEPKLLVKGGCAGCHS